mgnify:FL=1
MITKTITRVLLKKDIIINEHSLKSGTLIRNTGYGICTCREDDDIGLHDYLNVAQYDSGYGYGDNEKTKKYCDDIIKMVENNEAEYVYEHYQALEEGEKPVSCNGCPNLTDRVSFGKNDEVIKDKSCYVMALNNVFRKPYTAIEKIDFEKHFNEKTKPNNCPI